MSTPPPFLPSSRYGLCSAGGKVPAPNAETSTRKRGRRHTNARPSYCVGGKTDTLRGQLISPKEGTREKPAAFARKQRANSPKRPTFARGLRDFVPRLCAGQRNSESTERQRRACAPECERPARSPRCATSHCAAPPSRNETLGCRRATGSTTKRPSPLESRKGRSGAARNGWQLTLRQRSLGRDQDLRSNSWRFSRRLVSRNS